MPRFTFPSLGYPDIGYSVEAHYNDLWDQAYHAHVPLSAWSGWFHTYGDGLVQHSPAAVVCEARFADYCASLTRALLDNPQAEVLEAVSSRIGYHEPPVRDVAFAVSVRYKGADKPLWYSRSERKASASRSKEYDKRWQGVPEWADGGYASVLQLLGITGADRSREFITRVKCAEEAAGHYYTLTGRTVGYAEIAEALGMGHWRKRDDPCWEWHSAFSALNSALESYRQREWAKRTLNCYESNMGLQRTEPVASS